MLGPPLRRALDQDVAGRTRLTRQSLLQCRLSRQAQTFRALLDRSSRDLRHLCRRRARPRRIGKHMQEGEIAFLDEVDRKSTRLNSSHGYISYAVFCLKK